MAAPEGIGLGDLITRVADELRKAHDQAPKGKEVIALSGCELTLAVTVGVEVGGGLKIWLLDLSAKGKGERVSTIKLTFDSMPGTMTAFEARQEALETPIDGGRRAPRRKEAKAA